MGYVSIPWRVTVFFWGGVIVNPGYGDTKAGDVRELVNVPALMTAVIGGKRCGTLDVDFFVSHIVFCI